MSARLKPRILSLAGMDKTAGPERTQAALAAVAAGGLGTERYSPALRPTIERAEPESDTLAAFAARLRVGGLASPPPLRADFVRELEQRMDLAWAGQQVAAMPTGSDRGIDPVRGHLALVPVRPANRAITSHRMQQNPRDTSTAADLSLMRRVSRMARGPRATFAAAAAVLLLAVGGLSGGADGLLVSPTLTPTVGAQSATPSPVPQTGSAGGLRPRLQSTPGESDMLLVADANAAVAQPHASALGPAPRPRPTPRTDERSG